MMSPTEHIRQRVIKQHNINYVESLSVKNYDSVN